MSLSKNDRKLQSKSGTIFHAGDPGSFAQAIANALRAEFGGMPSALKTVSQLTRSNERAVRNWFDGKNAPSGENLVVLMRHSDHVLRTILTLADRPDLAVAVGLENLRRQLVDAVAAIDGLPRSSD